MADPLGKLLPSLSRLVNQPKTVVESIIAGRVERRAILDKDVWDDGVIVDGQDFAAILLVYRSPAWEQGRGGGWCS